MYRSSDLAEIVTNPSPVTRKYLDMWFNGSGAYGIALTMLDWPIHKSNKPLLVWDKEHGLRVNVTAEEEIMYSRTLFHYVNNNGTNEVKVDLKKFSFPNLINTMRIVWSQSKLLTNYQRTYNLAKSYVENIPPNPPNSLHEIENGLQHIVWPRVIAVDYIGEYIIATMTHNLSPEKTLDILTTIHTKVRDMDWYTKAMLAWSDYKEGKLSEQDLLTLYGYAAGDDYELTRPRYYELLKKPKPEIGSLDIKQMKINNIEDLAVGMHYLRSEAKRRSLIWIAALREHLNDK